MIARIWRTGVDPERIDEYERFERDESIPMFRQQPGFLGVLFLRTGDGCATLTLWKDDAAVQALDDSPSYRIAVEKIEAAGFLRGVPAVETFRVAYGALEPAGMTAGLRILRGS